MNPTDRAITEAHAAYCAFVGSKAYPVSAEFACHVARLHEAHNFRSACDIGSGFTSWLLRFLKIPTVHTYEHGRPWLDFTREFCATHDAGGVDAFDWPAETGHAYDLVLYDSAADGGGAERTGQIPLAARMVAPGGLLMVDDFNWQEFRGFVRGYFTASGWPVESLERQTSDHFDRFAGLVGPKP